ncbi:hypothetical protein RMN57_09715 [Kitasatospora sp. CM 4170]|uniref:Uncharacterized protein n=1 Tax=Kitasatospora aburaviensis TaxID=67265 RepID=A0ABW1EZN6_9ACTN|nr:hypothetical protein [Kitasatospora sp. CM 4170]WNM44975.1 hypothetical protein RMN57_09715 [Kitasatospora sp. CM 4170]
MEGEIVQQVMASGATTVVGLMATDAWTQVRTRLAALFARGRGAEEVSAELEEIRVEVVRAGHDAEAVEDSTAEVRGRIRRLVRQDPAAAAELQEILEEFRHHLPEQPQVVVNNTIHGGSFGSGIVVQAHTSTVNGVLPQEPRPR